MLCKTELLTLDCALDVAFVVAIRRECRHISYKEGLRCRPISCCNNERKLNRSGTGDWKSQTFDTDCLETQLV
jgi:hypothetical protein